MSGGMTACWRDRRSPQVIAGRPHRMASQKPKRWFADHCLSAMFGDGVPGVGDELGLAESGRWG